MSRLFFSAAQIFLLITPALLFVGILQVFMIGGYLLLIASGASFLTSALFGFLGLILKSFEEGVP